jgi:hypothetical protein
LPDHIIDYGRRRYGDGRALSVHPAQLQVGVDPVELGTRQAAQFKFVRLFITQYDCGAGDIQGQPDAIDKPLIQLRLHGFQMRIDHPFTSLFTGLMPQPQA